MKNKILSHLVLVVLALCLSQTAHAYVPLIDNQPPAIKTCPLDKPVSTQAPSGRIGSMNVNCVLDGINVVYTVTVPPGCEKGGCGLIFDNHGAFMNAYQQNAGTKLRQFGWTAKQYGAPTPFIVVQPNLTDLFDKEKGIDTDSIIPEHNPNDYRNELPNMIYFIDHMYSVYRVDRNRTHMHGFSRGGSTVQSFYCDVALSDTFASYAISGQYFFCNLNKPLFYMFGDKNYRNGEGWKEVEYVEAQALALYGVVTTTVVDDPDYSTPAGFPLYGKHHHMRFTCGDLTLETIRHSASTYPMRGHCHPSLDRNKWLVCRANMETGQKLIDFFIRTPRPQTPQPACTTTMPPK